MRKLGLIWFTHLLVTVAGWYALSALAQGAADSQTGTALPLVVFNLIMQILGFPVVMAAVWAAPNIGGFSPGSFLAFLGFAGVNSAVVVGLVAALIRGMQRRNSAAT